VGVSSGRSDGRFVVKGRESVPGNRCGVSAMARARPPVLIVERNQANVKCFRRERMPILGSGCFCSWWSVSGFDDGVVPSVFGDVDIFSDLSCLSREILSCILGGCCHRMVGSCVDGD